jgi:hypothetical protein
MKATDHELQKHDKFTRYQQCVARKTRGGAGTNSVGNQGEKLARLWTWAIAAPVPGAAAFGTPLILRAGHATALKR